MSLTRKGKKPSGFEYWGKRPGNKHGATPGPETKRRTHKAERREGKRV
jgi:hypothetical protein